MRFRKDHPIVSIINSVIVDLPSPASISYMWNFGSLLGLMLAIQIVTGIFLSMHYCADGNLAFASVSHILKDVNYGFLLKYMHANGASFFFIFVYLHIARGLYYGSYLKHLVWNVGVIIYILMMATAFIGYVLPWGQMSFWGATVITNLVSAVPYVGTSIVEWLWGGYSVGAPTLNRFFSLHYLLPFVLAALAAVHIIGLHTAGSNNPLGLNPDVDKIHFHSYFTSKDLVTLILAFILLLAISIYAPNLLGDVENFIPADSLKTPEHIQPEWYFLFAYAILRSIPNKLGGVVAMFSALLILLVIPLIHTSRQKGLTFRPIGKILYWLIITNFFLLTWIGAKPVEDPYILVGQVATFLYFLYPLILMPTIGLLENKLLTDK